MMLSETRFVCLRERLDKRSNLTKEFLCTLVMHFTSLRKIKYCCHKENHIMYFEISLNVQ